MTRLINQPTAMRVLLHLQFLMIRHAHHLLVLLVMPLIMILLNLMMILTLIQPERRNRNIRDVTVTERHCCLGRRRDQAREASNLREYSTLRIRTLLQQRRLEAKFRAMRNEEF